MTRLSPAHHITDRLRRRAACALENDLLLDAAAWIDALQAQVEELKPDKARLDWIEQNRPSVERVTGIAWNVKQVTRRRLRDAIDAAIDADLEPEDPR